MRNKAGIHFFSSLKAQLILSFILLSALVLALNSLLSYRTSSQLFQNRIEDETLRNFRQSEYNITTYLNEIEKLTNLISIDPSVQQLLVEGIDSEPDTIVAINTFIAKMTGFMSEYSYLDSIYMVTDEMKIVGTNRRNVLLMREGVRKEAFQRSLVYTAGKISHPKTSFIGGYTFGELGEGWLETTVSTPSKAIVAVKGIGLGLQFKQIATLMIVIDEQTLSAIYGKFSDTGSGNISLLNEAGEVISSTDSAAIGNKYPYAENVVSTNASGSFTEKLNGETMQIVYYTMSDNQWSLVNEVPTAVFSSDIVKLQRTSMVIFICSILFISFLFVFWAEKFTKPLNQLLYSIREVGRGKVGSVVKEVPNNEIGLLINQFNRMSLDILHLIHENSQMERRKRELEMEMLQNQIQPHFLYNTLNTIKWMALAIKAGHIASSIETLGHIIRPLFRNKEMFWEIGEEMTYIQHYVRIMRYRYGEDLILIVHSNAFIRQHKIPRLALQPLVENAILHGMKNKDENKRIEISMDHSSEDIVICVADNGEGMPEGLAERLNRQFLQDASLQSDSGDGIGLRNVDNRIKLHFGSKYGLHIQSDTDTGTSVYLSIPTKIK